MTNYDNATDDQKFTNKTSESDHLRDLYVERQMVINQIKAIEYTTTQVQYIDNSKLNYLQKQLTELNEKIFYIENLLVSGMETGTHKTFLSEQIYNDKAKINEGKIKKSNFNKQSYSENSNPETTYYPTTSMIKRRTLVRIPFKSARLTNKLESKNSSTQNYDNEEGMSL